MRRKLATHLADLGYVLEQMEPEPDPQIRVTHVRYMIRGPRGALYALWCVPSGPNSDLLFVTNARARSLKAASVQGAWHFLDDGEWIRPLSERKPGTP